MLYNAEYLDIRNEYVHNDTNEENKIHLIEC